MSSDPIVLMFAHAGKALLSLAESLSPGTPPSPIPGIVNAFTEKKVAPSLIDAVMLFDSEELTAHAASPLQSNDVAHDPSKPLV